MSIPLFRPPSVEEASRNAHGNESKAEKTVFQEIGATVTHVRRGVMGLLRAPVSLALGATAKGINLLSNLWGYPAIVGYRLARYVDDTRDAVRKVTDFEWSSSHAGGHHAHAA